METNEKLKEILSKHELWLASKGAEGERADLSEANLRGANLREADLRGANLSIAGLDFTPDPDLIKKVAAAALEPNALNMNCWHTCKTTHCIAGWAVTLHPDGRRLEENSSTYLAGRLLLGDEAASHFFDSDFVAIEWLKTMVK